MIDFLKLFPEVSLCSTLDALVSGFRSVLNNTANRTDRTQPRAKATGVMETFLTKLRKYEELALIRSTELFAIAKSIGNLKNATNCCFLSVFLLLSVRTPGCNERSSLATVSLFVSPVLASGLAKTFGQSAPDESWLCCRSQFCAISHHNVQHWQEERRH